MGWIGWGALIVGVLALVAAAPLLLGAIYPPRALATQIIRSQLTALGIEPRTFSDTCIGELADGSISTAKLEAMGSPGPWRSHLQGAAESTALMLHAVIIGEGDYAAVRIREEAETGTAPWVWQVLAKHDPKRFDLKNLEAMQDTNAMLRSDLSR